MSRSKWSQRQDIGPSPRGAHALAYHSGRNVTVLFGGQGPEGVLRDTWQWDGHYWTQLDNSGPSARAGHAMAYSGARCLLFGGALAGAVPNGDTWSWNGQGWTQIDDSGPSGRFSFGFAAEPGSERLLLFGGSAGPNLYGDTWVFEGDAWTQLDDSGPSPRAGHILVPDPAHGGLLLMGGANETGGLADTWVWAGEQWTQVQDIGPGPRAESAAAAADRPVLFGGSETHGTIATTVFGSTWHWDGARWTQREDIGPAARWGARAVLDADRSMIVLFGGFAEPGGPGFADSALGDTWELPVETPATPEDALTLIDFGPAVLPSDSVLIQFQLAVAPTQNVPVTVTLGGTPISATPDHLPAGRTEGLIAFSALGRQPGPTPLELRVGLAQRTETLNFVSGTALTDIAISPTTLLRGASFQITAEVVPAQEARIVRLVLLRGNGIGPFVPQHEFPIPAGQPLQVHTGTVNMAAAPGQYQVIAVTDSRDGRSASRVVDLTVT